MKTKILLPIVLLLINSCTGVRKVDLQKELYHNYSKISDYQKQISEFNTISVKYAEIEKEKTARIDSLSKVILTIKTENENLQSKLSEENSLESKFKTSEEYFESGQLKSKTSETESKQLQKKDLEIDYWKSSASFLKEQYDKVSKDLESSHKTNFVLNEKISLKDKKIAEFNKNNKIVDKYKNKTSEKSGLSWYWIVLITLLSWELLKFITQKYKII